MAIKWEEALHAWHLVKRVINCPLWVLIGYVSRSNEIVISERVVFNKTFQDFAQIRLTTFKGE